MSQENVEIVRQGYEALNTGDVERALAMFDPELETHLAQDAGTVMGLDFKATYHGIDGFLEFMTKLSDAWEYFRWEPEGYFDAGGDAVVVPIRMEAKGRASQLEIEQPMAHVCTLRDGKLVRHETFWEREAAFDSVAPSGPIARLRWRRLRNRALRPRP